MLCKTFYLSYFLVIALSLNLQVSAESNLESVTPWISQINYATNSKTANCQDCNGYNKWVEIYNPSSTALDLTGYKTSTGLINNQSIKGLIIPAGGVGYLDSNLNKQNNLNVDNKTKATVGGVGAANTKYKIALIDPNGKVVSSREGRIDQNLDSLASVIFCSKEDSGQLSQTNYQTLSNGTQLKASLNQTPTQKKECKQETTLPNPIVIVTKPTPINNIRIDNQVQLRVDKEAVKEFANKPIQEIANVKVIDTKPALQTEVKPNTIDTKLGLQTNPQPQLTNEIVVKTIATTKPENISDKKLETKPDVDLFEQVNLQPAEPEIKKSVEAEARSEIKPVQISQSKDSETITTKTKEVETVELSQPVILTSAQVNQPKLSAEVITEKNSKISESKTTDHTAAAKSLAAQALTQQVNDTKINTNNSNQPIIETNIQKTETKNLPLTQTATQNQTQSIPNIKIDLNNNLNSQIAEMQIPNIQKIQLTTQPKKVELKIESQKQVQSEIKPEIKSELKPAEDWIQLLEDYIKPVEKVEIQKTPQINKILEIKKLTPITSTNNQPTPKIELNNNIPQINSIKTETLVEPTFDYAKEIATLKTPQKITTNTTVASEEIPKEQSKFLPIQTNLGILSLLTILAYLMNQFQRFRLGTVVNLSKSMTTSKK